MGRLLEALRADSGSRSPANPAKVANLAPFKPEVFADSQDSQRIAAAIRAHLLSLAAANGIDAAHVHRLHEDDLAACRGCTNATLRDWLRLRNVTACMDAGRAPQGYTKAVECYGCGPVLLWQSSPDRVIACPWCFRRKAGKAIPRPATATTWEPCA